MCTGTAMSSARPALRGRTRCGPVRDDSFWEGVAVPRADACAWVFCDGLRRGTSGVKIRSIGGLWGGLRHLIGGEN
jgi:hypothetical protein